MQKFARMMTHKYREGNPRVARAETISDNNEDYSLIHEQQTELLAQLNEKIIQADALRKMR